MSLRAALAVDEGFLKIGGALDGLADSARTITGRVERREQAIRVDRHADRQCPDRGRRPGRGDAASSGLLNEADGPDPAADEVLFGECSSAKAWMTVSLGLATACDRPPK